MVPDLMIGNRSFDMIEKNVIKIERDGEITIGGFGVRICLR